MLYEGNITDIFKCLSTQATYINQKYGQLLYYTDTGEMYADTQDRGRILATDVYIVQFDRERVNYIPDNRSTFATEPMGLTNNQAYLGYTYVYVVETNCLYKYYYSSCTWEIIFGHYGVTTVAQTRLPNGDAVTIYADDVTNNGILNDGSVVIRDTNKTICGQIISDGYTLTMRSLVGGQINLEPSGSLGSGDGCLQLNSSSNKTNLNNDLVVYGAIYTMPKEAWKKQYRLATDNISIVAYTTIVAGSLLKAGSSITNLDNEKVTYNTDTKLTEDISGEVGIIVKGSKLYIGSVINNGTLKPPYEFDIDIYEQTTISSSTEVDSAKWSIDTEKNSIKIDMDSPLRTSGDCLYLSNIRQKGNITSVTKIVFNDYEYSIEYIANSGISETATIKYYAGGSGKVKIIP